MTYAAVCCSVLVTLQVFVGGMPYSYSREQVAEYWSWCGTIETLDMLTFPDSGRFRCCTHHIDNVINMSQCAEQCQVVWEVLSASCRLRVLLLEMLRVSAYDRYRSSGSQKTNRWLSGKNEKAAANPAAAWTHEDIIE